MKKIIRLTEGELYNIIGESVSRIIRECDGAVCGDGGSSPAIGGGATGTNTVGGPTSKYQFDVPFGAPLRKNDDGFYTPALKRDRKKGISMNRLGKNKKKNDD